MTSELPDEAKGSGKPSETKQESPTFGRIRHWLWLVTNAVAIGILIACIVGIVTVRSRAGAIDFAKANLWTLVLAFFAFLAVSVMIMLARGAPLKVRLLPLVVAVLGITLASALLRVDGVDGRLVPKMRFRWSPTPGQLLEQPDIAADSPEVDLISTSSRDFSQFLGPQRNLIVTGKLLDRDWTTNPPKLKWRQPIGAGWSGFSAVNGFAITIEQRGPNELVTCYEVMSGKPRWVHSMPARHETFLGGIGPRSTPTIHEGLVYALGATGILRCLDGRTGELIWSDDIPQRYGVTPEEDLNSVAWGRSASPLVIDDLLVVPFGGPPSGPHDSLAAYNRTTGELIWKAGTWQVGYASPTLETACGMRQIVIVNEDSVSGHRPQDGMLVWSHPWPGGSTSSASTSQAVILPGDRVFLSKDYGVGSELLQLRDAGDETLEAESIWAKSSVLKTKFTNVVATNGFIYGLSDGILECIEADSGKRRWKDRKKGNFGHGQILAVEDVLLVQAESGEVVMVELNPDQLIVLGRFAAIDGRTWNNLCLFGQYLLVRNATEAACYELAIRD